MRDGCARLAMVAGGLWVLGGMSGCQEGPGEELAAAEASGATTVAPTGLPNVAPYVPPLAVPARIIPDVEGEVIVKLASATDAEELLARRLGGSRATLQLRRSPGLQQVFERFRVREAAPAFGGSPLPEAKRVVRVKTTPADVDALIASLRATPGVVYAEPNRVHTIVYAPNDPFFASSGSWGQPYADLWGHAKVSVSAAWNTATTLGAGVIVAVVDSGVDYGHPDIAANLWQNPGEVGTDALARDKRSNGVDDDGNGYVDDWRGWNFANASGSPQAANDPMDDHGHGTHVAGTIAAVGNNAAGIVGVAPSAKIMALKGIGAGGSGSETELAAAIYYAARNGAKVINASWGVFVNGKDQTLIDAVKYAHDAGVVFVAGAGNNAADVGSEALPNAPAFYPAAALDALTVGATTHLDQLAGFSNFGAKLDVIAPGGGDTDPGVSSPDRSILSLLSSRAIPELTGSGQLVVGTRYLRLSGTSMAAPHVAGVAALIRATRPTFTPEQVRAALRAGATDLFMAGWDTRAGYGRLDAAKAVGVATPLNVHLTGPTAPPTGTTVAITGTAAGAGFTQWRLEYGAGPVPTSWTTITTSATQVTNGALTTWNVGAVPDGRWIVRLSATGTGGAIYEDRLPVVLSRVSIDTPRFESDQQFRPGALIELIGSVESPGLTSYAVTITGLATGAVSSSTITRANGGTQRVTHGLLATWNTTGLPNDRYTITVTASASAGIPQSAQTRVTLDATLHPGFPWDYQSLGGPYSGSAEPWFGMGAADLDGDGAVEILDQRGHMVYVLRGDGTPLPGWPQELTPGMFEGSSMAPVAGDITGDGVPEVICAQGDGQILAFSRNGVMLPGWPTVFPFTGYASVVLADMNGDGVKDVIETGYNAQFVNVVGGNGATLPGWPISLPYQPGHPAVGDVDGDGKAELVVPEFGGLAVYVYKQNGTLAPGWPKALGPRASNNFPFHFSWPALADLDGDAKLDIIVGSYDGVVRAWRGDGTVVAGWPKTTVTAQLNAPAVGDIDGDGSAEVVIGAAGAVEAGATVNYLYAWRANGTALPGWPVRYAPGITTTMNGFLAPVLADVDGDGKADVVVGSDVGVPAQGLHAYRYTGVEAAGFPKATPSTESWQGNAPAVADFDGDGLLEVLWDSYSPNGAQPRPLTLLTLWDLPSPKTAPQPWPMFGQNAAKTGVLPIAAPPPPTLVPLSRTGWTATASANPGATPVTNAFDASTTTRWATGAPQANGQYYQLDLQTAQTFSRVVLDSTGTAGNYPRGYQVFVSNDGASFGAAVATGVGTGNVTTIDFPAQTARFIRIMQTGSAGNWWSIYDLTVLGPPPTPVALPRAGWIATASSNASTTGNALDGVTTTRWTTGAAQTNGQYFQVDMVATQTISQVTVDSGSSANDYPRGWAVYVSMNGVDFGAPVATGAGTNKLVTASFTQTSARFVRVVQTGAISNWWSIAELNVFGLAGGPPPPAPLPRTGWTALASNNTSTTGNALDGATTTRWTTGTAQTGSAWFQVDMAAPRTFNQLTLDSGGSANDYPRGWAVSVSQDGVAFGAPIATGAGTNKLVTITFPLQTARYVRIALTAGVSNWWSIAELDVWR